MGTSLTRRLTVFLVGLALTTLTATVAQAQIDPGTVSAELSALAASGASPGTLWNHGYQLYNRYPPTKQSAQALAAGYRSAGGGGPEQAAALAQAARHWKNRVDYWGKRGRPVAWYWRNRDFPYNGVPGEWESNLRLARPRGGGVMYSPVRKKARYWDRKR